MLGFGKRKSVSPGNIAAVVSGQIIPIEKVKDEAFAKKMMGDGVAIVPSDDYIVSPCDGTVSMLYPTLHAFAVTSEDGMDILIHIGIDTVKLKGKGFRSFVKQGQKVHVGERIIRVDSYDMKNKGIDLTTMILFPSANKKIAVKKEGYADQGKAIIMVSSEMPELLSTCDRIIVFRNGEISGILNNEEATEEKIMYAAVAVD